MYNVIIIGYGNLFASYIIIIGWFYSRFLYVKATERADFSYLGN